MHFVSHIGYKDLSTLNLNDLMKILSFSASIIIYKVKFELNQPYRVLQLRDITNLWQFNVNFSIVHLRLKSF